MGLEDLTESDSNSSSTDRQYASFTAEEFADFLANTPYTFRLVPDAKSGEVVFETEEVAPNRENLSLRIYSTVDKKTRRARGKGDDAIRTVLWDKSKGKPVGGRTKTLRIKTWKSNLRPKIESIIEETEDYVDFCPDCKGYLEEREGEYGKFLGCTNYPECKHTENINGS